MLTETGGREAHADGCTDCDAASSTGRTWDERAAWYFREEFVRIQLHAGFRREVKDVMRELVQRSGDDPTLGLLPCGSDASGMLRLTAALRTRTCEGTALGSVENIWRSIKRRQILWILW